MANSAVRRLITPNVYKQFSSSRDREEIRQTARERNETNEAGRCRLQMNSAWKMDLVTSYPVRLRSVYS